MHPFEIKSIDKTKLLCNWVIVNYFNVRNNIRKYFLLTSDNKTRPHLLANGNFFEMWFEHNAPQKQKDMI